MDKEVIEGNVTIANFMGVTVYPDRGTPEYKKWKGQARDCHTWQLEYERSWSALMPVYKKVREAHKARFDASKPDVFTDIMMYLTRSLLEADIEATHEAIVKFITFYNPKTQTNG